jgi:hypothetical protein
MTGCLTDVHKGHNNQKPSVQFDIVLLVVAIPNVPVVNELPASDELVVSVKVRVGILLQKKRRACESKTK